MWMCCTDKKKAWAQLHTSSQQKSPCLARLMGSSSLALCTSCGHTRPTAAAKFWLSSEQCAGTMLGHNDSFFKHHWGFWDSCAALVGSRVISSHEGNCLCLLSPKWPMVWEARLPRSTPCKPPGAHQPCFPRAEMGSFISAAIWFSHFQWGKQLG